MKNNGISNIMMFFRNRYYIEYRFIFRKFLMNISVIEKNIKSAIDKAPESKEEYLYVSHIKSNILPTKAQLEYESYFRKNNIDNKIEINDLNNDQWQYDILFFIKNPYFDAINYFGDF